MSRTEEQWGIYTDPFEKRSAASNAPCTEAEAMERAGIAEWRGGNVSLMPGYPNLIWVKDEAGNVVYEPVDAGKFEAEIRSLNNGVLPASMTEPWKAAADKLLDQARDEMRRERCEQQAREMEAYPF